MLSQNQRHFKLRAELQTRAQFTAFIFGLPGAHIVRNRIAPSDVAAVGAARRKFKVVPASPEFALYQKQARFY